MIDKSKIRTVYSEADAEELIRDGWCRLARRDVDLELADIHYTASDMYLPEPTLTERLRNEESLFSRGGYDHTRLSLLFREAADALERADRIEAAARGLCDGLQNIIDKLGPLCGPGIERADVIVIRKSDLFAVMDLMRPIRQAER